MHRTSHPLLTSMLPSVRSVTTVPSGAKCYSHNNMLGEPHCPFIIEPKQVAMSAKSSYDNNWEGRCPIFATTEGTMSELWSHTVTVIVMLHTHTRTGQPVVSSPGQHGSSLQLLHTLVQLDAEPLLLPVCRQAHLDGSCTYAVRIASSEIYPTFCGNMTVFTIMTGVQNR